MKFLVIIFLLLAFGQFQSLVAQNNGAGKVENTTLILPEGVTLNKAERSIVIPDGYSFKKTGASSGVITPKEGSNLRMMADVRCACKGASTRESTGSCIIQTDVGNGVINVACISDQCSTSCEASIRTKPISRTPGKNKSKASRESTWQKINF